MPLTTNSSVRIGTGVAIAVGLLLNGFLIGRGVSGLRSNDRYVSVKGLAEKSVDADLVIWPIGYKDASDNLATIYKSLQNKNAAIVAFLLKKGFVESEITLGAPVITDMQAENFDVRNSGARYKAESLITVHSNKVKEALAAMKQTGELISQNIALAKENWDYKTEFEFTKLNEIKPSMIEEATKNARAAAEQFAKDSGSHVGKIRQASQGLFSIDNLDKSTPHVKNVRVVTTIDYLLD